MIDAGRLDREIIFEAPTKTRDAETGAEVVTWAQIGEPMWAEIIESAFPGSEAVSSGVVSIGRPTRVRCRYRSDIDETMRINEDGRLFQILGLAMFGSREGLELACKEWAHE